MQPTQGDIVIPSEENVVRLPLGYRDKTHKPYQTVELYSSEAGRHFEVPILDGLKVDNDNSSGFDREFLFRALETYAKKNGVDSPSEFAREQLAILDGERPEYDPNGPYL